MNKKVGILYLYAALLFAQPAVQAISLNQIANLDTVKRYVTQENCVKATFATAIVAFVVYALWKIQDNTYKKHKYVNSNLYGDLPSTNPWNAVILQEDQINLLEMALNIYNSEKPSNGKLQELLNYEINSGYVRLLVNEFVAAYKDEKPSNKRIEGAYNELFNYLTFGPSDH